MRLPSRFLLSLCLIAVVAAAYAPLWRNEFIDYDDEKHITDKPQVLTGLSAKNWVWAWTYDDPYWIPLSRLSLQLDAELFGSKSGEVTPALAVAVHVHNLFWHIASTLMLFALLGRLTGARWRSFLVAALFGLHPLHVESVAWAVERKDVLSCFFGLLTIWAYVRYQECPHWLWYLSMLAAYALSLLAKPMLMTLPFVLLLLDYWPLQRRDSAGGLILGKLPAFLMGRLRQKADRRSLGWLLLEKLPLFLLAACCAATTLESRSAYGTIVSLDSLSLSARAGNALSAYAWYLKNTIYPHNLSILYLHPANNWSRLEAGVGAFLLLSLTYLSWKLRQTQPWLLVGWLWFVGTLVPVIGFAQGGRQAWADRFSYWPHIGLFIAVVWGLADLAGRVRVPAAVLVTGNVVVLAVLGLLTGFQVTTWRSSQTVWERAVDVTHENDVAHEHLSVCYRKQGRTEEANYHLIEAGRIQKQRNRLPEKKLAPHPDSPRPSLTSNAAKAPWRP